MNARVSQLPAYDPQNWDAEVGRRIKTLLIGRATQSQLGATLGLGQTDISRRLSGLVAWKGRELADVADALGVPVGVLYGEPSMEPTHPTDDLVMNRSSVRF